MNATDVVIVVAAVVAILAGFRMGFLARASSWLGLGVGLLLAGKWAGVPTDALGEDRDLVRLAIAAAVLAVGAIIGQILGTLIGTRLAISLPRGTPRSVDRFLGALAGLAGVLIGVWILVPAMSQIPEWPARQARGSAVARAVSDRLPRPEGSLRAIERAIGADRRIFVTADPTPNLPEPPELDGLLDDTLSERAAASTVRVVGTACQQVQEGTGFLLDPAELPPETSGLVGSIVVTNAHVVAGERDTEVFLPDGERVEALLVGFDPGRDLAFLLIEGLMLDGLALADGGPGDTGVAFGHPSGGPLRQASYEIHEQVSAVGFDIYRTAEVERDVFYVSSDLRSGDSGAALVGGAGAVVGVAFAVAPDADAVAFALTAGELREAIAETDFTTRAATGDCIAGSPSNGS